MRKLTKLILVTALMFACVACKPQNICNLAPDLPRCGTPPPPSP